jgi:hypothetical protein
MPTLAPMRHDTPAVTASYYSMRRLSPYQGTVQVVELPGFRAMSKDGHAWELRIEAPGARPRRTMWREGDVYEVEINERNAPFLLALRDRPPLPFALADTLELWLLDAHTQAPLALLASALPHMAPPNTVDTTWRASFSGDDSFVAPSLQAATAHPAEHPFIAHREVLSRCVRTAAGTRPSAQWFLRGAGGVGHGLNGTGLAPELIGRDLEAREFPALLLRDDWGDAVETALVRDYHDWLAPTLLTHSNLTREQRERLERAACAQAEKLFAVRHLLPEVINHDLIEVALVEAVLRRTNAAPT